MRSCQSDVTENGRKGMTRCLEKWLKPKSQDMMRGREIQDVKIISEELRQVLYFWFRPEVCSELLYVESVGRYLNWLWAGTKQDIGNQKPKVILAEDHTKDCFSTVSLLCPFIWSVRTCVWSWGQLAKTKTKTNTNTYISICRCIYMSDELKKYISIL